MEGNLAGFFTKVFVLLLPITEKLLSAVFFILALNCVACLYYINIIKIVYFTNPFKKIEIELRNTLLHYVNDRAPERAPTIPRTILNIC